MWTYKSWAEWLDAKDWHALKHDHSLPPTERV